MYIMSIILLIILLILIYILIKISRNLRIKVYELFLKAEHNFISSAGESKMNYVVENIYCYLPVVLKIFISVDTLKAMIQKMFDEIKDLLDDGKVNKSIDGRKDKDNE